MTTRSALATAALCSLFVAATASAQPMMMDPSRMSGIPRPDPQVPAGTITVRLIRGELANRITGTEVRLSDAAGKVTTQKTDAEGRATFGGLQGGASYQAKATVGSEELTSQAIELANDMGSRVMLVFPADAKAGVADGIAHPDKQVPPGEVIVRALGDGGQPAAGVDVVVGHMRAGEKGVREFKGKTNGDGEAVFTGLDAKPTSGYLAEVLLDGQRYASQPFRLQENMGSRVSLDVRAVSTDTSALRITSGSHYIFEVTDEAVQVTEILRLTNPTKSAINPGPNGLHIPLPDHALSPQAQTQASLPFKVAGHEAVLSGSIPPGDTPLQLGFVLAYTGEGLDFTQRTPIAYDDFAMVTEKIDGFRVDGDGLSGEERELQGRKLILYRGAGPAAGGTVTLHLHGLPHPDPTWRFVAAGVTVALLLGFGVFAAMGRSKGAGLGELEGEREQLLAQLAALAAKAGTSDDDKRTRRMQELKDKLARVYRALDEVHR